jgi:transposase InsO family protein
MKTGVSMKLINENEWQYNSGYMKHLRSLVRFNQSNVAQVRSEILEFCKKHGVGATVDAYGVSRRTLFRWKRVFRERSGSLESLIPSSRSPHTKRKMMTYPKVIEFIRSEREKVPHLGKEKIKPLLDEYCLKEHLPTISISTIGKVIKRHHMVIKKARVYHSAQSKWNERTVRYKTKVKRSPKVDEAGYIEVDTILTFIHGIKLYVFNAVDIKLKFQFSYGYSTLTSRNSRDFFKRLELVYPLQGIIHTVQTDNGLEYLGDFRNYLEEKGLRHLFIYPRCPKINGFVERANRTLQEEFIEQYIHTRWNGFVYFNRDLMEYLVWYNTKRVHKSLNNKTPIDYLLSILPSECQMYVTHTHI